MDVKIARKMGNTWYWDETKIFTKRASRIVRKEQKRWSHRALRRLDKAATQTEE